MKKFLSTTAMAVAMSVGAGAVTADAAATPSAATPSAAASAASRVSASAAAPSADADAAARGRPKVRRAAKIVTLERVYGSNYRIYKERYPRALKWANNGCSVPAGVVEDISDTAADILRHYGAKFQKSCDRHDFGYRNHGRHGYSRKTVDRRFRDNMYHQCDVLHTDGLPPWWACRGAAKVFFEVVDSFGGRWW